MLFILTVMIVYAFQLFTFLMQIPRLLEMSNFYTHLLGIPDVSLFKRKNKDKKKLMIRSIYKPYLGPRLFD